MTVLHMVSNGSPPRANAARRRARETALESLGEARACVASREEWLHWVEEGKSLAPWADGEWAATGSRSSGAAPADRGREPSVRDEAADDRDSRSAERDRLAAVRDRLADAHDAEVAATLTPRRVDDTYQRTSGREIVFRAQRERERAADHRRAAAEQRADAALDREHSREDREMAARDRLEAAEAARSD